MGQFRHRNTSVKYVEVPATPNPNPRNFKVVEFTDFQNGYVYLEVNYPDCKNFEGNKILVYHGLTAVQLMNMRELDPHFSKTGISPVARFAPTDEGKRLATLLCKTANVT